MKIPLVDRLAAVNLFLALFNMIPAFPMDGGRVLRALLASRFGYVRATEIAASIGQFVAFALGFIGLMVKSDPDLHRDLRLSRRLLGSAHGGAARGLARRAGELRHDDAVRDAVAGGAYRRGGADAAADRARANFRSWMAPASRSACSAAAT